MTPLPDGRRLKSVALRLTAALLAGLATTLPARASQYSLPHEGNMVGEMRVVTASAASTLYDIARHYDLGTEEIAGANPGVDMWLPKAGQRVVLPTVYILPPKPWTGLVVNVGARRVYYFPKPKQGEQAVVITYPLGIARDNWPTPIGMTRIAAKVKNPSWVVPKDILEEHLKDGNPLPHVVPPGPDNPMGLLALRTAMTGIYIHGTSEPWGVGDRVSHGCMHLYPEDVSELFPRIPVGAPVRIVDQPYQVGERDGVLYMAGYEPLPDYHNPKTPEQRAVDAVTLFQGKHILIVDWDVVKKIAAMNSTVPLPITPGAPEIGKLIASLPAEPYVFPPYGDDANSAAPPKRQLPVAAAPGDTGNAVTPGAPDAGDNSSGNGAAGDNGNAATGDNMAAPQPALDPNETASPAPSAQPAPAAAPSAKPATSSTQQSSLQPPSPATRTQQTMRNGAAPPPASSEDGDSQSAAPGTAGSAGASAPSAADPDLAGTAASAPSNPAGIY
jgi:L,D-transpeptidase ErfK/SrfK